MKISKNKVSSPSISAKMLTAGKILKERRLALGYSLQKISEETKIQKKYLEQIERDENGTKESVVFINGFIKIYAGYLGLDVEKVSALYRRSIKEGLAQTKVQKSVIAKVPFKEQFQKLITPQNVVFTLIALFIIGIGGYLSVQFYNFQRPPLLNINAPQNNSEVTETKLEVKGTTEPETLIKINGETINVNSNLTFKTEISLKEGTNTITITATKQNNTNNQTVKILTVNYEPKVTETPEAPPATPTNFTLKVSIVTAEAWVQVIIDGTQKEAAILPVGYSQSFEFKDSFKVISGRPANTKLLVNNKEEAFVKNAQTGGFELTCEVDGNSYECR
ncbi:MAG: helix-turn-helix domain-containing protein [Candidatus Dojkabacteria bacterium]